MPEQADDPRLPSPGDVVMVDLPRRAAHEPATAPLRVVSLEGSVVHLADDLGSAAPPAGFPVIVTWKSRSHSLFGTVIGQSDGILSVRLATPPDQREFARLPSQLPARLELLDGHQPTSILPCSVIDLSEGGMALQIGSHLTGGGMAFVAVDLPDGEPVVAVAEIIDCVFQLHENRYIVRVRFEYLSPEQSDRLREYLVGR